MGHCTKIRRTVGWLGNYYRSYRRSQSADGKPLRSLPLDADLNRKPMWSVLAKYM
jgi:hypothetical protein